MDCWSVSRRRFTASRQKINCEFFKIKQLIQTNIVLKNKNILTNNYKCAFVIDKIMHHKFATFKTE